MTVDPRLPGPTVWALGGALVAVMGFVLPQWWFGASAMSVAYDVPFIAIGMVSLYAQRAMTGMSHGRRLWAALAVAGVGAICVGVAAYWLYANARPMLLADQFARRLMTDPGRSAELKHQAAIWLDPVNQALQLAALVLFVGFLIGSFTAFSARIAQRHRPE